jgi:hypothetical protein
MRSDERFARCGCDEARIARAWEEVRAVRDARRRRNAWCLMGLAVVVATVLSHDPLGLQGLLAHTRSL